LYRLFRLVKLSKSDKDIKRKLTFARILQVFHINEGILNVISLLINILFLNHFVACFWHFIAKFDNFSNDTWVSRNGLLEDNNTKRYIAAFYWSTTTLVTLGYGDIAPFTTSEMIYSCIWMLFGVGFFSFMLGKLTSVLSSIDKKTVSYIQKIN